jgi:glycosyltransferase involved in cell wall biosynthesis
MSSLSIIIPALNEERRLAVTVTEMLELARSVLGSFEIIVVDDGSSDRTGEIADSLAAGNPEISVVHNAGCRGLGFVFSECMARAKCEKFMLIPGDHAYNTEGFRLLLESIGSADLIVGYRTNQASTRSGGRVFLSWLYCLVLTILFGFKLKDFHGPVVYPLRALRQVRLRLIGYTFQIEAMIKLLRRNQSFVEVPVTLNPEHAGTSRSFRWKTFWNLVNTFCYLLARR